LEILQISENCDIADQFGARPQQRVNEYSSLRVHVGELSVVVCSVKELPYGGVARALRLQLLFDCHPFGPPIKPRTFAGEARHIELSAVILVDVAAVGSRKLDPPFLVHPDRVMSSEHPANFVPSELKSRRSTPFHFAPPCRRMVRQLGVGVKREII